MQNSEDIQLVSNSTLRGYCCGLMQNSEDIQLDMGEDNWYQVVV